MARVHTDIKITWVDYYLAVKRGDLEVVRKATDKDCRIALSMDGSAIELAAMYGHVDLFDYFTQTMPKTDDHLLVKCVDIALRNGHTEIAEKSIDVLGRVDIVIMSDFDLYASALESGNLECLKFVHDLLPCSDINPTHICQAFEVGSEDILHYIMEIAYLDDETVASIVGVPTFFVHIALNEMEKVWEEIESNENWHSRESRNPYDCIYSSCRPPDSESRTPMDIAALFGHFEILKELVAQMDQQQLSYFRANVNTTICFTLQKDLKNIVEYLTDEIAGDRECPCYLPGLVTIDAYRRYDPMSTFDFMTFQPGYMPFQYDVRDIYRDEIDFLSLDIEISGRNQITILPQKKSIGKLLKYLVSKSSNYVRERASFPSDKLFILFLAEGNVDAALALQRITGINHMNCINFRDLSHVIRQAMTYPVILQLLLGMYKLQMIGKEFYCGGMPVPTVVHKQVSRSFCMTSMFLRGLLRDVNEYEYEYRSSWDPLVRKYQAILKLFLDSGFKLTSSEVIEQIPNFHILTLQYVYSGRYNRRPAAIILNHLQCCKIDIDQIRIQPPLKWFGATWRERDEFLTKFLIALSRNGGKRTLHFKFLLTYFIKPKERSRHFLNCLEKTRLSIIDEHMTSGLLDETPEFLEVQRAILRPKVPTLQELSRSAIHSHCLTVADASSGYSSAEELVKQVASQFLPNHLENWLQYSDIFETLNYEATPRIWTSL